MVVLVKKLVVHLVVVILGTVLVVGISNWVRDSNIPRYLYADIAWHEYRYEPVYDRTRWNILFDQHSHTTYSDGVLTPEQNIRWHIAMGFNAMVISDHNTFAGIDEAMQVAREKFSDQIIVIPGLEWTTNRLHMNFLFPPTVTEAELSRAIEMPPSQPTDAQIEAAIKAAQAFGALVTVNHIPWTDMEWPGQQPGHEQFLAWGVDFIEVLNEDNWDTRSYEFIQGTDIRPINGTDMHRPGPAHGWSLLHTDAFTAQALFASLRAGETEILYLPEGTPYPFSHQRRPNPAYTLLRPLIAIGDYFTELTWPDIRGWELVILLGWAVVASFVFAGLRALLRLVRRLVSALSGRPGP